MKIYIISTYNEYGAENVVASTNCDAIIDYLKSKDVDTAKAISAINEGIEISESGLDLGNGWGGYQLHIVELL